MLSDLPGSIYLDLRCLMRRLGRGAASCIVLALVGLQLACLRFNAADKVGCALARPGDQCQVDAPNAKTIRPSLPMALALMSCAGRRGPVWSTSFSAAPFKGT